MAINSPADEQNVQTYEQIFLQGSESNKHQVLQVLLNMTKADYVSEITQTDKKAIDYNQVITTAEGLLTEKTKEAEDMWSNVIAMGVNNEMQPQTLVESLHFEDRRQFFKSFVDKLAQVQNHRDLIKEYTTEGKENPEWHTEQNKLNNLIL